MARDPKAREGDFPYGFAENYGGRYRVTQRVIWDGAWKLSFNGFDVDELYNLDEDPGEMNNRIDDPACREHVKRLMARAWKTIRDTGDHALLNSKYPILRLAPYGPGLLDE